VVADVAQYPKYTQNGKSVNPLHAGHSRRKRAGRGGGRTVTPVHTSQRTQNNPDLGIALGDFGN